MRGIYKTSIACLLAFAILIPTMAHSEKFAVKMERGIPSGTTEVTYAGETFIFTTTVPVQVTFEPAGINRIKLSFKVRGQHGGGGYIPTVEDQLQICWVNWNNEIFSGLPPSDPRNIILDTESGYTEK